MKIRTLLSVAVGSLLTLQAGKADIPPKTSEFEPEFLDKVYFGNDDSEGGRVTITDAPVIEGGLDVSAREVAPETGVIEAEMAVDPDEQTLLTVRLWAGKPSATHLQMAVEGEKVGTRIRVAEPKLPGRFYYVTIGIPTDLTAGKDSVELTLTAGNNSPDHAYAAYTHVENFYAPPADEVQGEPLDPPEPSDPDFDAMRDNLLKIVDAGINQTIRWQNDNENSKKYGNVGGVGSRRGARAGGNFLRAYKLQGSGFHGDEEMIERALRNFDYHCRYQGYRGTLELFYGKRQWIGGPDRSGIGGGLPGFMGTYLGRSFLEAIPIFKERPELLEEKIDSNGDGEKTITRGEAYTQFWRDYLWENMLLRFGIAQKTFNQIVVNGTSMVLANQILEFLSPEDTAPDNVIRDQLRAKAGILPIKDHVVDFVLELQLRNHGEYGQAPGSLATGRYYSSRHWHWSSTRHFYPITPKGTGIEFGYTPGYGSEQTKWSWMVEAANDHQIADQFRSYLNGYQHVTYPILQQNGSRWGTVGAIGSRNPRKRWGFGNHLGWIYAAVELDHEPAKRVVRELLRHMHDFGGREFKFRDSHSVRSPLAWLRVLPALREWYENEEPTDYRLPAEREEPYSWIDEMIGLIMVHDVEGTYYASGWGESKEYHRITPEYRAFGDAKSDFCHATHLETIKAGPYVIAMNRSNHRDVRVEGGPRVYVTEMEGTSVLDLVSGKMVDCSKDQLIEPYDSLVLDLRRQSESPETSPQPRLTSTEVDEAANLKRWTWNIPGEYTGAGFLSLPLDDSPESKQVAAYYEDAATLGTKQHANQVPTFYRPDKVGDRNPVTVRTADGRELAVETVDGCQNRLVVERPPAGVTEIEATGIRPTFDSYNAWDVERTGDTPMTASTDSALEVNVDKGREISGAVPVTFTLPLKGKVKRIVFTHESSWDFRSDLRMVLETADGETLWRETKPAEVFSPNSRNAPKLTDEMVNLEDLNVKDAIHFRVKNTAPSQTGKDTWYRPMTAGGRAQAPGKGTTVEDDWFRRIRNVRIEYADGTARYPHR